VYEAYIDFIVPVELASFSLDKSGRNVILNWSTATEFNNRGFQVERKLKNNDWEIVGFIEGKGTTSEKQFYTFTDNFDNVSYDGRLLYRLKQIDLDGSYEYSRQVYTDVLFSPREYMLSQNYPNPFNPSTSIRYSLPLESQIKLVIINSLGEEVVELFSGIKNEGFHEITWNAEGYPSGVYFCQLKAESVNNQLVYNSTKKLILVK
jgi:hypothetical protein